MCIYNIYPDGSDTMSVLGRLCLGSSSGCMEAVESICRVCPADAKVSSCISLAMPVSYSSTSAGGRDTAGSHVLAVIGLPSHTTYTKPYKVVGKGVGMSNKLH